MRFGCAALVALAGACIDGSGARVGHHSVELAARADLVGAAAVHGELAVLCEDLPATDALLPECDVFRLGSGGQLEALGVGPVLAARDLGAGRALLVRTDRSLEIHRPGATPRQLARNVADLQVSADGSRIAFAEVRERTDDLYDESQLVVMDLARGTRWIASQHPLDSQPYPVPGSDEVLFVSGRTGLASMFLASPGAELRQVTNVGKTRIDDQFVPVPAGNMLWVPGRRVAVFSTYYDSHQLWSVDIDSGRARHLGPGRSPVLTDDGEIVAFDAADGSPRVVDLAGPEVMR